MSKTGFGKMPNESMDDLPELSKAGAKLSIYLCLRASRRQHRVAVPKLAEALGVGTTAAKEAIKELVERGWVEKKTTGRTLIFRWRETPERPSDRRYTVHQKDGQPSICETAQRLSTQTDSFETDSLKTLAAAQQDRAASPPGSRPPAAAGPGAIDPPVNSSKSSTPDVDQPETTVAPTPPLGEPSSNLHPATPVGPTVETKGQAAVHAHGAAGVGAWLAFGQPGLEAIVQGVDPSKLPAKPAHWFAASGDANRPDADLEPRQLAGYAAWRLARLREAEGLPMSKPALGRLGNTAKRLIADRGVSGAIASVTAATDPANWKAIKFALGNFGTSLIPGDGTLDVQQVRDQTDRILAGHDIGQPLSNPTQGNRHALPTPNFDASFDEQAKIYSRE